MAVQAGVYTDGFMRPSDIGFPDYGGDINNHLQMRLFPIYELQQAFAGDPLMNQVFIELFQVSNVSHLMGDNFQEMPGVILSMSLGSPPVSMDAANNFDYIIKRYADGSIETVRNWITKYLCNQLGMLSCHLYFYRENGRQNWGPNWGGLCSYLDITEGTLLARHFNVSTVIDIIRGQTPHLSITETQGDRANVQQYYNEALQWLQQRFQGQDINIPLGLIYTLAINSIFRKFKHLHLGQGWATEPPLENEAARRDYHNYNLRVYFIRRRGRFVHDTTERIVNGVPPGMPAPVGEANLSTDMWKALAQYYRFMSCWMQPSILHFQAGEEVFHINLRTLRRFVTRDAHATGSSSWTSSYDSTFFNIAAQKGSRTILLGIENSYKHPRHAKLYDGENTRIRLSDAEIEGGVVPSQTLGILAGICWFFNPSNRERFISYPIFRIPFDNLRNVNVNVRRANGQVIQQQVRVPTLFADKDIQNYLGGGAGSFYVYGLDEYMLSEFVSQQFNIPARWDEINLLFYNIYWLDSFINFNTREYSPLLHSLTIHYKNTAAGVNPSMLLADFIRGYMMNQNNLALETFFSSSNDTHFFGNYPTIANILDHLDNNVIQNVLTHFYPKFTKLIQAYTVGTTTTYRFRDIASSFCFFQYLHRYDRPFYWKNNAQYALSQRLDGGQAGIVPNNFSDPLGGLSFVIRNQISRPCGVGLCVPDDEIARPTSGTCPGMAGGKRQRKLKSRRQRKRKM